MSGNFNVDVSCGDNVTCGDCILGDVNCGDDVECKKMKVMLNVKEILFINNT